jgi:hypothetical protein
MLRERLAPGGLAVSWAPTDRVVDTFAEVFTHSMLYEQGYLRLMIGSNDPLAWNAAELTARLRSPFSTVYYARAGIDLESYARHFASTRPVIRAPSSTTPRPALADLNTDLFPRDEVLVPRPR